jgi:glycosyltransferase involved in cell wall biosynthesis
MKPLHIVFISHTASRSGAPIVLLHFLKWLKAKGFCTFSIILKSGGELSADFEEVATTYTWNLPTVESTSLFKKISKRLNGRFSESVFTKNQQLILRRLEEQKPSLIYANTVDSLGLAILLKEQVSCPLLCHVHELQMAIDILLGNTRFIDYSKNIDHYIAASESVKNNLTKNIGVSEKSVDVVYEFIDVNLNITAVDNASQYVLNDLGIPGDAFIIGGSGTIEWRKGVDLFIHVALLVKSLYNIPAYFIWVGGNKNSQEFREIEYDINKLGLGEQIIFTGSKSNPQEFISLIDVFLMTSREDPYPLVCLEAALLKKPILCFENSGGIPEFISTDSGYIVPYLRTDLMADKLAYLHANLNIAKLMGAKGHDKIIATHDVTAAGPRIISVINKVLNLEIGN